MGGTTYYKRNKETVSNRLKHFDQNIKKVLREKARTKYRELPEEEKNVKGEYGRNRYHNISEEKNKD